MTNKGKFDCMHSMIFSFSLFTVSSIVAVALILVVVYCIKVRKHRGRAEIFRGNVRDLKRTISEPISLKIIPPEGLYEIVTPIERTAEEEEIQRLPPAPPVPDLEEIELRNIEISSSLPPQVSMTKL